MIWPRSKGIRDHHKAQDTTVKRMTCGNVLDLDALIASVRTLGIGAGETVLVHSSLKGTGRIPAGPAEIVKAFQEVLTGEGNLLMPAFTYGYERFSVNDTPAQTGLLTETFRKMSGVIRSWHPTHSVCAWGTQAQAICSDHQKREPFGLGSPLDRFVDLDGKVLLIGVSHTSSSTVHVAERRANAPYLHVANRSHRSEHEVIAPDGTRMVVTISEFPGHSGAFNVVEKDMRVRGYIRDGKFGARPAQIMKARHVVEVVADLLREQPDILLCADPNCYICTRRREVALGRMSS